MALLTLASAAIVRSLLHGTPVVGIQNREHEPVTASKTWTNAGHTITVTTTRGVAGPGENAQADESFADWKARHLKRVSAVEAVWPPGVTSPK